MKFAISQPKVVWLPRNKKQTYRFELMGLTLAMTLIFEFSRSYVILTIWWPRLGVRIYQIVTGVTSDVSVPSTRSSLCMADASLGAQQHIKILSLICFNLFFSCDQAALSLSVRLSVRPSVCPSFTPFSPCCCHRIITKFSGVIAIDKSDVHAKGQGQRSRSQRSWPHLAVSGP